MPCAALLAPRQHQLLEGLDLPSAPALAGRLRFVLPTRLGAVALFDDVSEEDVRAVLGAPPLTSPS
jgi:hypothetical protein